MGEVVKMRARGSMAPELSVNLLTDREYSLMKNLCPHDVDITVESWAAWLSAMLGRKVSELQARSIIEEYNARLAAEFVVSNNRKVRNTK